MSHVVWCLSYIERLECRVYRRQCRHLGLRVLYCERYLDIQISDQTKVIKNWYSQIGVRFAAAIYIDSSDCGAGHNSDEKIIFSLGRTDVTLYFQSGSRRSINSAVEAAMPIAPAQSIGSIRISCTKGLWFDSFCVQTFCNFFLFAVIINVFFGNNVFVFCSLFSFEAI